MVRRVKSQPRYVNAATTVVHYSEFCNQTESAKKTEQTKNSSYTQQIIEKHACPAKVHAHQCYLPTKDDGISVPADMIGKCIQIPITMQATWAAECVSVIVTPNLAKVVTDTRAQLDMDLLKSL
jgi:cell envelope opacity-associated protein A